MRLLVDNNLAPRLARAIDILFLDHEIVALRDKFAANTSDIEWIGSLDREGGWAMLTKDLRLRTRPHERAALDRSRIVFFFLTGSWTSFGIEETAARLIRLIPNMALQARLVDRGRFDLPINSGARLRPQRA